MKLFVAVASLFASMALAGAAFAALPERVRWQAPACADPAFDPIAVESILRVELAADGVREVTIDAPPKSEPAFAVLSIEDACEKSGVVVATLGSSTNPARKSRSIDLSGVAPPARARTVAIALAELLRTSWSELQATPVPIEVKPPARVEEPPPRLVPEEKPVVAPSTPVAPRRPPRAIFVSGDLRSFAPKGGTFAGAHATIAVALSDVAAIDTEIGAWRGSANDPLGSIDGWFATIAIDAERRFTSSWMELDVGPTLEGGVARFSGAPIASATGGAGSQFVAIGGARASLGARVFHPLWVALDAGAAAVLHGAIADAADREPIAVRNAAFRFGGGIGLEL